MSRKSITTAAVVGLVAASFVSIGPATAQDPEVDELVLEEIQVTARRYAERVQDAPLSVNVMTDEYLRSQKVESVRDMLELSPGASYVSFSKVQPEKSMRGVVAPTPGNSSSEQSIQSVVDGMVVSKDFMKSPAVFDIQRVEVLRGPQGTTFGRNASIGLIQLITKRPTREFEAGINATAGSDELFEVDGFISGPLSNTLAGRLAFNYDREDGPTKSISTGKGLDGDSNFTIRGSLLFEPSDRLNIFLKAEYSEDDDEAPVRKGRDCTRPYIDGPRAFEPLPPPLSFQHPPYDITFFPDCDPFKTEISSGTDFFLKREILTLTGEINFELAPGINITSITGFMDGENDGLADVLGSPVNIVWQKVTNDGHMFSQELRIDNHGTGNRFRWLGGVYYLTDEEDRFEQNQFFQENSLPFPRVPSFLATISSNKTDSIAVFGELLFDVTQRLEIAVGGRWTHDEKDYLYSVEASGFAPVIAGVPIPDSGGLVCAPPNGIICGTPENPAGFDPVPVSDEWEDFTAKASATFRVNENNTVYALWSQGFKSGGFQPDARTPEAARVPFDPERSNNFEVGYKGDIRERARVALTAFYLKNKGTQTVTLIPVGAGFTGLIGNVGSVETWGVEGEFTWLISRDFRAGGTFAAMDPELVNTVLTVGVDGNGDPITEDLSGQRPEAAPRWTGTLYAEYDVRFGNGSILTLRGDFQGRDNMFDDSSERAERTRIRPQITNFGARATWTSANGRYRVMAWGKNLNEDEDVENIGPRQPNTLQLPVGFSHKRTFGVTASASF